MQRLLLIENGKPGSRSLKAYLTELGYKVSLIVRTAEQAIENANTYEPDFIVLDYDLNKTSGGASMYDLIRQQNQQIPIICMTAPAA